jgi:hypothetical protein
MDTVSSLPASKGAAFASPFQSSDSSSRPFNVLKGFNLGNNTLLLSVPMRLFYEISAVANEQGLLEHSEGGPVTQRKLDPKHAEKLATYILKGLINSVIEKRKAQGTDLSEALLRIQRKLGRQPYLALQPVVANLRPISCRPNGEGLTWKELQPGVITVWLGDRDILWVIDGQHRRFALEKVFEYLKDVKMTHEYPKRNKLYAVESGYKMPADELAVWMEAYEVASTTCSVMVEVHLGLDAFQERQLFHDLNNLGKKVESSLAFVFDSSNPVNLFIKDELIEGNLLNATVVEKDIVDWHNDPGEISWKDLTAINAILFLNKTNIKGAQPGDIQGKFDVARRFWQAVSEIDHFGQPRAKQLTVAAQPVVLKAIAKLTYDFAFGRSKDEGMLHRLLDAIPGFDWSHTNPMWRYYEMRQNERDSSGLSSLKAYLPNDQPDERGASPNRDLGSFDRQGGTMRFGAKHNDIYPVIGDMIRWRLNLPSRHLGDLDAVLVTD